MRRRLTFVFTLPFLAVMIFLITSAAKTAPFQYSGEFPEGNSHVEAKPRMQSGRTYYVASNGNDSNPGTIERPWKTLGYASQRLSAGDTLYIRGGTYSEVTNWQTDGRADARIYIRNYPGEQVVIDGYNTIPAYSGGKWMFMVWGDWYYVSGLEIKRTFDEGAIGVKGAHVTIDNCFTHHNWGAGITMMGDYGLAQNNRVWYNGVGNENMSRTRGGWPAALTCARYPNYCTLRGNISWENWGEGISTFEANATRIEGNLVYNNLQNIYISDTRHSIVEGNFVYCSPGNIIDPFSTQNGILVGDERKNPPSAKNQIINNIVYGCDHNLALGTNESTDSLIAHNTLVNADEVSNILIYSGNCSNCRFLNNLVIQENSIDIAIVGGKGWAFSNNLWSKTPPGAARGGSDIIGSAGLTKNGSPFGMEWYMLTSGSNAVNRGMYLSEVPYDYAKYGRIGAQDIGALEYRGAVHPTTTPGPSATPYYPLPTKGAGLLLELTKIGAQWGKTGSPGWIPEDVNQDGRVSVLDLTAVAALFA